MYFLCTFLPRHSFLCHFSMIFFFRMIYSLSLSLSPFRFKINSRGVFSEGFSLGDFSPSYYLLSENLEHACFKREMRRHNKKKAGFHLNLPMLKPELWTSVWSLSPVILSSLSATVSLAFVCSSLAPSHSLFPPTLCVHYTLSALLFPSCVCTPVYA